MPPPPAEFGKLGTRKRSVYLRPATVPRPFHLATPQRSRRPQSIEGAYPPAKAPGVPLEVRLHLRDAYLHPPRCAPEEGKGCMERETEKETEKG